VFEVVSARGAAAPVEDSLSPPAGAIGRLSAVAASLAELVLELIEATRKDFGVNNS